MKNTTKAIIADYIIRYPFLEAMEGEIVAAFDMIYSSFTTGGKLLICGNGGSAADSDHIVGELMKGFIKPRHLSENDINKYAQFGEEGIALAKSLQGAFPAINLGAHTSLITAIINDIGADNIYAQQVLGYGTVNDVFFGISTSGNSKNVLNAGIVAKALGIKTVALTGKNGGRLNDLFDVIIRVPSGITDEIQNMHNAVYHLLCAILECERWG